jgi:hypothetical protein
LAGREGDIVGKMSRSGPASPLPTALIAGARPISEISPAQPSSQNTGSPNVMTKCILNSSVSLFISVRENVRISQPSAEVFRLKLYLRFVDQFSRVSGLPVLRPSRSDAMLQLPDAS